MGPLHGIKVLEFGKARPGSFAGMMMSDLGADVLRIEREDAQDPLPQRLDGRGRRSVSLNLKDPVARELCLDLFRSADLVMEGHRPGVMERLGLGPTIALEHNPRLIYGRLTGWGQNGAYAESAGHDINYIALAGVLRAIGGPSGPVVPLNLVGDAGGSLCFIIGLLAAIINVRITGKGQVVDAAMSDSAAYLMSMFYGMTSAGTWREERASNMIDGGAPFYNVYRCADGEWIAIGAIEPRFYAQLLDMIGATGLTPEAQLDRFSWAETSTTLGAIFGTRTRQQWCDILEQEEVCFSPVLSLAEAPSHPHFSSRGTFVDIDGIIQPAPVPRFSETPARIQWPPAPICQDIAEAIEDWRKVRA